MDKKYMIVTLILLILVLVGGVYFWKTKMQKLVLNDAFLIEESTPDANPYNATNPYSDIKVNPFE